MSFSSEDTESTPLLGDRGVSIQSQDSLCQRKMVQVKKVVRQYASNACTVDAWKTRFPITKWITKYR